MFVQYPKVELGHKGYLNVYKSIKTNLFKKSFLKIQFGLNFYTEQNKTRGTGMGQHCFIPD